MGSSQLKLDPCELNSQDTQLKFVLYDMINVTL